MARLVGLALVLAGATVFADPAPAPTPAPTPPVVTAPAKPVDAKQPLRLVRITPDGKAALLLDKNRNRSVLVEVGDGLAGYIVETIEDDAVTLVHKNGTQLVLAAAAPSLAAPSGKPESKAPQDPYAPAAAPSDPYAPAAAPADPYAPPPAPADPYAPPPATAGPVTSPTAIPTTVSAPAPRVVSAPSTPGGPPVATSTSTPTPTPTMTPAPAAPRPVVVAPVVGADGKIELKKADVDAALRDFGALAASIGATFTGGGLKVDSVVAGSLFARAGLQAGDIVVAVEGRPLRTLDDAADLYARAATLRAVTVQVVRGGKPGSFQIAIR